MRGLVGVRWGSDRVWRAGAGGDREGRDGGGAGGSHRSMGGHRNEKVPVAGPVVGFLRKPRLVAGFNHTTDG